MEKEEFFATIRESLAMVCTHVHCTECPFLTQCQASHKTMAQVGLMIVNELIKYDAEQEKNEHEKL